jgi:hypothetical protein
MVERFHRHLKDALRAHCATDVWAAHLPWVTPGLRTPPSEEEDRSPADSLGSDLILPGPFLSTSEQNFDSSWK